MRSLWKTTFFFFFLCCRGIESNGKHYHANPEENTQMQNLSQWWLLHVIVWIISKEVLCCMDKETVGWIQWNTRLHNEIKSQYFVLLVPWTIFRKISLLWKIFKLVQNSKILTGKCVYIWNCAVLFHKADFTTWKHKQISAFQIGVPLLFFCYALFMLN